MLAKRIIPCLDVKNGVVVKGVSFRDHKIVGGIMEFARRYNEQGADEIVCYDITASSDNRSVSTHWITQIAKCIEIPLCVAGGIRDIAAARKILNAGADKISINSPALENPNLICELADVFGRQCVVVGVDSFAEDNNFYVCKYSGDEKKMIKTNILTFDWIKTAQELGAGEIVLNCINKDGVRHGYDLDQLKKAREILAIPLIASGGAGSMQDFADVFQKTNVDGALAASFFHIQKISISELKKFLKLQNIEVRL